MSFIDVVRWDWASDGGRDASGNPVYAWRFREQSPKASRFRLSDRHPNEPLTGTNLSTRTQLIVSESQEAVLFSKGKLLGKFGPGKHTLNTENLPLLRNLFGLPFGGNNPFTAEVWFVNKATPLNIDWATDAMMYHDPDYQTLVPLVARGQYGLRVDDAERFLVKLVGIATEYTAEQLTTHFKGALVARTKSVLLQYMQAQRLGIKSISAYLEPLSESLKMSMLAFWEDYGFSLIGFYITAVEVDNTTPEGARILEAMSRQSAQQIAGYTWQQSQAFEVADRAASAPTGSGGLFGAVMLTGMAGGLGPSGGGLLQPPPSPGPQAPANSGMAALPPRDVFCSNCAKKYSNTMKFCPHCGDPYIPCGRCGTDNDAKAKRCVSCGTPMACTSECVNCHAMVPADSPFCPQCGRSASGAAGCSRCGAALAERTVFCPHCGQKTVQ
jgi:membrane protease subunit (stomatin/prohibitin family)